MSQSNKIKLLRMILNFFMLLAKEVLGKYGEWNARNQKSNLR